MPRALLTLFLIGTLSGSIAQVSAQPHHAGVYSVPGGTGDDGCVANYSTTEAVFAYSEPSTSSEHIRTVDANRRIDWNDRSEALTVIIRPAIFRALHDVTIGGINQETSEEATLNLAEGDRIEVLAYSGEGNSYFRRDGQVYVGYAPGIGSIVTGLNDVFELETEPVIEVWVRLINHDGKPRAWVNVSQPGVVAYGSHCGE
ncbi:MAG: hypothetical protein R3284_12215 [Rubricoccaceae bacterium]|nr:hypothetical protein [Rubricoccaceae bacterium]